jgi:hypothetical protein
MLASSGTIGKREGPTGTTDLSHEEEMEIDGMDVYNIIK